MTTTFTPDVETARTHLLDLELALNGDLVERTAPIKTLLNALVSETHHFQLGGPGVAKSALIERAHLRISGATFFRWLLTKFTAPEEIFGPFSLMRLEQDEYIRITEGKLPNADYGFLDEAFKANSAILNSLLTILNERLFFNGHTPTQTALSSVFTASNEMPQGDELGALFDRLHFRHVINPVTSSSNFMKMMTLNWTDEPEPVIGWDEVRTLQAAARAVEIPGDVFEAINELRNLLKKEGIEPTERKFRESRKIIKAAAVIGGRMVAEIDDMQILQHVMWSRPEDIGPVTKAVMSLANPLDKEAQDLMENVEMVATALDTAIANADSPSALARQSVEYFNKLTKAKGEIEGLSQKFSAVGRKSQYLDDLKSRYQEVAKTLQYKCFNTSNLSKLDKLKKDDA